MGSLEELVRVGMGEAVGGQDRDAEVGRGGLANEGQGGQLSWELWEGLGDGGLCAQPQGRCCHHQTLSPHPSSWLCSLGNSSQPLSLRFSRRESCSVLSTFSCCSKNKRDRR